MPPIEIFIGPVVGFAVFYLLAWSMRNRVLGPTGPRHYAAFAAKAMGVLLAFGIISRLAGWDVGTLDT